MTLNNLILRLLKIWLAVGLALVALHRLRDGGWNALPADLGWAAAAAAIAVAGQRWHASRGAQCALCVDESEASTREVADHV